MVFNIFEAQPGCALLIEPDSGNYRILAVSDDFVRFIGVSRDVIKNKNHLEVYPQLFAGTDPEDINALRSSYQKVKEEKQTHQYQLQDPETGNSNLSIRNVPVLNETGSVQYIIHVCEKEADNYLKEEKPPIFKSLEKVYNFFMTAPVIIGLLRGDDYIIEMANEGLLEVWGRSREVIGKPLLNAIPELESQGIISLLEQVRNTGQPFYAYEFPITLNRNGKEEVLFFDFVYKPFYEDQNEKKAIGVISVGHNVTAQVVAKKKVEDARKESESQKRLYETINGNTPDLIYVFDLNYRFTYVNQALLNMWGKSFEDSVGRSLLENGYEPWHAEMHEREIDQVVVTRLPVRGEVAFPHAELGKRVYDYIFVPVLGENGQVEAVAGTTRDITEHKMAEQSLLESNERFKNLADESPIFVFIIDPEPDAPVQYWNKTWLTYTGQNMEEAKGNGWNNIIHPDDIPVVLDLYIPAFKNQTSYFIPSIRVKRKDGIYRWHAFKGNPRYGQDGKFNGYIGVGFDIHDQKLAEDALRESELQLQQKVKERTKDIQQAQVKLEQTVDELQRSNANLEEFAYAASHDLKEPLRKILVFSDRLKSRLKDKLQEQDHDFFNRMALATTRMNNLIDDLLQYSYVNKGAVIKQPVDMNELAREVLSDLDVEIEDKKATIRTGNLPVINGNKRQLQQLLQNLIGNALKYKKPDENPALNISTKKLNSGDVLLSKKTMANGSYFLIEFSDNGIGFPQEDAEKIFTVFTRLHAGSEYKGSGVGLSIVRKVVENHNGQIWAESRPGEGATFKVLLPVS